MIAKRALCVVLAVVLSGCMQQRTHADAGAASRTDDAARARLAARAQVAESARRLEVLLGQRPDTSTELASLSSLRIVGMDEGPVPDFDLLAPGGTQYSSKALVGQQPF